MVTFRYIAGYVKPEASKLLFYLHNPRPFVGRQRVGVGFERFGATPEQRLPPIAALEPEAHRGVFHVAVAVTEHLGEVAAERVVEMLAQHHWAVDGIVDPEGASRAVGCERHRGLRLRHGANPILWRRREQYSLARSAASLVAIGGTSYMFGSRKIRTVTRGELHERVWNTPMTTLAKEFGISDVGLRKICKRSNIALPPGGYWMMKQYGKRLPRKATLPLPGPGETEEVRVAETPKKIEADIDIPTEIAIAIEVERGRFANRRGPVPALPHVVTCAEAVLAALVATKTGRTCSNSQRANRLAHMAALAQLARRLSVKGR